MSKRIACFELENYTKSKIKVKSSYQLVPKLTDKTVLVNEQLTSIIDEFKVLTTQQMISSDFYDECNHITLIGYETSELLKTTMISLLNDALDRIKLIDDNSKAFKEDLAQCEAEFAKALGTITGLETITKSGFASKLLFMVSIQTKFGYKILSKLWALLKLVGIVKG